MDKHELESMTKSELVDYADSIDVDVDQNWLKDDIIKEIMKGQKAAAKHDDKFDSTKQHEANKASIQAENQQNEAVSKELAENQEIANSNALPKEGETREQLLARIRKMREKPEAEPEAPPFRSEGLQKEFDAEQKAGKEAVAKAQGELDKMHAALEKMDAGEKK